MGDKWKLSYFCVNCKSPYKGPSIQICPECGHYDTNNSPKVFKRFPYKFKRETPWWKIFTSPKGIITFKEEEK